jgi:hypothetical protein
VEGWQGKVGRRVGMRLYDMQNHHIAEAISGIGIDNTLTVPDLP